MIEIKNPYIVFGDTDKEDEKKWFNPDKTITSQSLLKSGLRKLK